MRLAHVPDWMHRLLWFAAFYAAGVGMLAIVALGLRALLKALA